MYMLCGVLCVTDMLACYVSETVERKENLHKLILIIQYACAHTSCVVASFTMLQKVCICTYVVVYTNFVRIATYNLVLHFPDRYSYERFTPNERNDCSMRIS